jgi:hypothetical protein
VDLVAEGHTDRGRRVGGDDGDHGDGRLHVRGSVGRRGEADRVPGGPAWGGDLGVGGAPPRAGGAVDESRTGRGSRPRPPGGGRRPPSEPAAVDASGRTSPLTILKLSTGGRPNDLELIG